MSRALVIALIIIALIVGGFFWLTLSKSNSNKIANESKEAKTDIKTITPVSSSQTILMFDNITKFNDIYTLPIIIKSDNYTITGAQIELSFDPQVITSIDVLPGTFFTKSRQLLKTIDTTNGTISYAIGINPQDRGVKGKGIIANLNFRAKSIPSQTTTISFLEKSLVTAEEKDGSVLISTIPTQFAIGGK